MAGCRRRWRSGASAVSAAKRRNAERIRTQRTLADGDATGRARTPTGARRTEAAALALAHGAEAPRGAEDAQTATGAATTRKTAAERLQEAKSLLAAGLLAPDEYEAKRKEIIAGI